MSHELKTPLTVLQGYLEMMQSMAEPDSMNVKPLAFNAAADAANAIYGRTAIDVIAD